MYNNQFEPIKTITDTPTHFDYKKDYGNGNVYESYRENSIGDMDVYDAVFDSRAHAIFTQTLFNDDDLFEFIRPLYELRSFTEEDSYYGTIKYTNYPITIGFEVVNETGEVLQTVKYPTEYEDAHLHSYLNLGDTNYLKVESRDEREYLFYPIVKGNTNSIQAPKIIKSSAKVYPTKVRSSEIVNVTLGHPLDHNCDIAVVSANGSIVYRTSIGAGYESAQIDTSCLSPGLYIVNICDKGRMIENCKIIIR